MLATLVPIARFSARYGLCVCLFLTGCGSLSITELDAGDIAAARQGGRGDLQTEVDALVRPLVETGHTPGVVVGVLLPDGTMQFFGYGVTDRIRALKPDGDTLFAIGSLSKEFLVAVAALLVDDGVFSWDDTLETLLGPDTPLSDDAKKITLLQLATHTSGLPRQPVTLRTLEYFVEYLFDGENFYRHFDTRYILNYLATFSADEKGQPQYSNIGYGIIGYIIERHTGKAIDTVLAEKITNPLGLTCTGYRPEALPCYATRAYGHAGDQPKFIERGEPTPDWQFTNFMRGSAGLSSNARDLLIFAAAHLKDRETQFHGVLANNLSVRVPQSKEAAAMGWVVDDVAGLKITYQIGIVAGYTSYLGIDVENKTAVVILQNSFNWDNSVGHKLLLRLANIPKNE